MNVSIFVDGNQEIGLGHLYRCLAIALYIEKQGCQIRFIVSELTTYTPLKHFKLSLIPSTIWNNPANNVEYFKKLTKNDNIVLFDLIEAKFIQFSFFSNFPLFIVSITLFRFKNDSYFGNLSFFPNIEKYKQTIGKTKIFSGSDYFLIRKEIRKIKRFRNFGDTPKCLLTMGGADPHNILSIAISALKKVRGDFFCYVITGEANKNSDSIISSLATDNRFICFKKLDNIANLYSKINCAIINGGNTRYELTFLGIPYTCISIHETQFNISNEVINLFGGINLGVYNKIDEKQIIKGITKLFFDKSYYVEVQNKMMKFNGGFGDRIIYKTILEHYQNYNYEKDK